MKRGRPLAANPEKTRAWQQRSREAQRLDDTERDVQREVFTRDGHRCQLADHGGTFVNREANVVTPVPKCWGPLSYHHRRKAGAQGAYTVENGATLCVGHNRWVEDEPDAAVAVLPHLVVREGHPEWDALGKRAARG